MLERVYFVVPDVCRHLTELTKEGIKRGVLRTNLQTALADFTGRFDALHLEMLHQAPPPPPPTHPPTFPFLDHSLVEQSLVLERERSFFS